LKIWSFRLAVFALKNLLILLEQKIHDRDCSAVFKESLILCIIDTGANSSAEKLLLKDYRAKGDLIVSQEI
jgi:hypothetical protein